MSKKGLLTAIVALLVFLAVLLWLSDYLVGKAWEAEARMNLSTIRVAQEKYKREHGVYLECKPSPANGGTDGEPDEWSDAGGFTHLGFEAPGDCRFQYAVTVNRDGFVVTATGYKGGKKIVYKIDSTSDVYPEVIKIPAD